MNNRQARYFAVACTAIAALVFLALTIDSHRQFPTLTNADAITPEVTHGKDVWHKYNCINCHTLFGEGAYYAPDLTKIAELRGAPYLHAYMRDPSQFYDEQLHRRLMPRQDLSDKEIEDLVVFLQWVAKVDNQGWPPRPIYVTGGLQREGASQLPPQHDAQPASSEDNAIARGGNLFRTVTPACHACHSLQPGADMAGPSLAGLATRTESLIDSGNYKGDAADVLGYIRESIVAPSAHLVPGPMFSASGVSFMPATYSDALTDEEIADLAAYLASFR